MGRGNAKLERDRIHEISEQFFKFGPTPSAWSKRPSTDIFLLGIAIKKNAEHGYKRLANSRYSGTLAGGLQFAKSFPRQCERLNFGAMRVYSFSGVIGLSEAGELWTSKRPRPTLLSWSRKAAALQPFPLPCGKIGELPGLTPAELRACP